MQRIRLAEAIKALRTELNESIQDSKREALRFEVGQVELEFHVELERTAEASGGIHFWVVEVAGKGTHSSRTTHVVKVPLTPVTATNEPVLTGLADDVVPD